MSAAFRRRPLQVFEQSPRSCNQVDAGPNRNERTDEPANHLAAQRRIDLADWEKSQDGVDRSRCCLNEQQDSGEGDGRAESAVVAGRAWSRARAYSTTSSARGTESTRASTSHALGPAMESSTGPIALRAAATATSAVEFASSAAEAHASTARRHTRTEESFILPSIERRRHLKRLYTARLAA
jgi:hypothetical protein